MLPRATEMQRQFFEHAGLTLSYLDSSADAPTLIALHAHWMEGSTFVPLAGALAPQWRVVALDQRGHGESSHAPTYTRNDYLDDMEALFLHQFAARHPQRVRALVVEDIGVEIPADMPYVLNWGGVFATKEELCELVGPRMLPYLLDSFRQSPAGWRLAFEPRDMIAGGHVVHFENPGGFATEVLSFLQPLA